MSEDTSFRPGDYVRPKADHGDLYLLLENGFVHWPPTGDLPRFFDYGLQSQGFYFPEDGFSLVHLHEALF